MNRDAQTILKTKRVGKQHRSVTFFSSDYKNLSDKAAKLSSQSSMLSLTVPSTTFQRKLHKICNHWTTVSIVNLTNLQSSWYLSSQALLHLAEKPLTLSLPGRWPWQEAHSAPSWLLISSPGEMTAVCQALFWLQLIWSTAMGAGKSWPASGAGGEWQAASW